jgi:recombination protein RecR
MIELSERQEKIVEIVKEHGPITGEKIAELLAVTRAALRPDLAVLTMSGFLEAKPRVGYTFRTEGAENQIRKVLNQYRVRDIQSRPVIVRETSSIYDAIVTLFVEDTGSIFVVEETSDVIAIERTGFHGRYYVLNKNFHLMEGFNLDDLHLQPLIEQLASGDIGEMVLALNPDIDGEVLSRYIADLAKPHNVRVTRLAHGLPVGGDIEFTDEITLRRALEGRSDI